MKTKTFSVIAAVLAALHFTDETLGQGAGAAIGKPLQGGAIGDTLPYGERAKSIFSHIADWTPAQFRNAVEVGEAKQLRDPQGNTVMHQAIATGNLSIVELLHNEYGFVGTFPNKQGETAYDLAARTGDEFVAVFGDMKPSGVDV